MVTDEGQQYPVERFARSGFCYDSGPGTEIHTTTEYAAVVVNKSSWLYRLVWGEPKEWHIPISGAFIEDDVSIEPRSE